MAAKKTSRAPRRPATKPAEGARPRRGGRRPDDAQAPAARAFLAAVRAQGTATDDVLDAWSRTDKLPVLTVALVGVAPSRPSTEALLGLFRHVAAALEGKDAAPAAAAIEVLASAIAATETRVKNRAAFELAEQRDRAIVARRPALAAFVDGLSHAAEAVASHADGDAESPPRRGVEVGRALLFAVAERRVGDGEDLEARKEASRTLAAHVRRSLPKGPWA